MFNDNELHIVDTLEWYPCYKYILSSIDTSDADKNNSFTKNFVSNLRAELIEDSVLYDELAALPANALEIRPGIHTFLLNYKGMDHKDSSFFDKLLSDNSVHSCENCRDYYREVMGKPCPFGSCCIKNYAAQYEANDRKVLEKTLFTELFSGGMGKFKEFRSVVGEPENVLSLQYDIFSGVNASEPFIIPLSLYIYRGVYTLITKEKQKKYSSINFVSLTDHVYDQMKADGYVLDEKNVPTRQNYKEFLKGIIESFCYETAGNTIIKYNKNKLAEVTDVLKEYSRKYSSSSSTAIYSKKYQRKNKNYIEDALKRLSEKNASPYYDKNIKDNASLFSNKLEQDVVVPKVLIQKTSFDREIIFENNDLDKEKNSHNNNSDPSHPSSGCDIKTKRTDLFKDGIYDTYLETSDISSNAINLVSDVDIYESFQQGIFNDNYVMVEACHDELKRDFLLFYVKSLDSFFRTYLDTSLSFRIVRRLFSHSRLQKVCLNPYRLYSLCAKRMLSLRNVFSLSTAANMYAAKNSLSLFSPLEYISRFIPKNVMIDTKYDHENLPELFRIMPYYCYLRKYMERWIINEDQEDLYESRTNYDRVLGYSYMPDRLYNVPDNGLFKINTDGQVVFNPTAQIKPKAPSYTIRYTVNTGENSFNSIIINTAVKLMTEHLSLIEQHNCCLIEKSNKAFSLLCTEEYYSSISQLIHSIVLDTLISKISDGNRRIFDRKIQYYA